MRRSLLLSSLLFLLCWSSSFVAHAELSQKHVAAESCQKKVSLVLVHGFNGSERTWTDLLGLIEGDAELVCVDAYTFSYQTGFEPDEPTIEEIAAMLRAELTTLAQTQDLILAAHSMGGIVIKEAILQDTASPQFLPRTRKVVFVASPHLGIRRPIALLAGSKSEQVKELRRVHIRKLQRQWRDTETTTSYTAIAATKDVLVTRHSAKGKFEDTLVVDGDHVSVAKPKTTEHPTFQTMKSSLIAALAAP